MEIPPAISKSHNVYHLSRLKPYVYDDFPTKIDIDVNTDGTTEQVLESKIGHKEVKRRKGKYLENFLEDTEKNVVWITGKDLKNAKDLAEMYRKKMKGQDRRERLHKKKRV